MTDLCMWDDTCIFSAKLIETSNDCEFVDLVKKRILIMKNISHSKKNTGICQ